MTSAIQHQITRVFTWTFIEDIKSFDWNSKQGHLVKKTLKIGLMALGLSLCGLALAKAFFWTVSLVSILTMGASVIILTDPSLKQNSAKIPRVPPSQQPFRFSIA